MPDHRSSDSHMPEWVIILFWSLRLLVLASAAFAFVAWGVSNATCG